MLMASTGSNACSPFLVASSPMKSMSARPVGTAVFPTVAGLALPLRVTSMNWDVPLIAVSTVSSTSSSNVSVTASLTSTVSLNFADPDVAFSTATCTLSLNALTSSDGVAATASRNRNPSPRPSSPLFSAKKLNAIGAGSATPDAAAGRLLAGAVGLLRLRTSTNPDTPLMRVSTLAIVRLSNVSSVAAPCLIVSLNVFASVPSAASTLNPLTNPVTDSVGLATPTFRSFRMAEVVAGGLFVVGCRFTTLMNDEMALTLRSTSAMARPESASATAPLRMTSREKVLACCSMASDSPLPSAVTASADPGVGEVSLRTTADRAGRSVELPW